MIRIGKILLIVISLLIPLDAISKEVLVEFEGHVSGNCEWSLVHIPPGTKIKGSFVYKTTSENIATSSTFGTFFNDVISSCESTHSELTDISVLTPVLHQAYKKHNDYTYNDADQIVNYKNYDYFGLLCGKRKTDVNGMLLDESMLLRVSGPDFMKQEDKILDNIDINEPDNNATLRFAKDEIDKNNDANKFHLIMSYEAKIDKLTFTDLTVPVIPSAQLLLQ